METDPSRHERAGGEGGLLSGQMGESELADGEELVDKFALPSFGSQLRMSRAGIISAVL